MIDKYGAEQQPSSSQLDNQSPHTHSHSYPCIIPIQQLQQLKSTHDSGLLWYFFCQGTDSRLNNAMAVLRGLIYQLLIQQQYLISYLREQYDKAGQQLFQDVNAFFALSIIFTKKLYDPRHTGVSCKDISVWTQALDLLNSMCDASNAKSTVQEWLRTLPTADYLLREEMVLKIATESQYPKALATGCLWPKNQQNFVHLRNSRFRQSPNPECSLKKIFEFYTFSGQPSPHTCTTLLYDY